MARPVTRDELVDYQTYSETRDATRKAALAAKRPRRVHVGDYLTFLFENHDLILYQVQEMMRVEQIVKEADIVHELETYNELLGTDGGIGCTLLIEVADEELRDKRLREWLDLPKHLYMKFEDGSEVPAIFDERQIGEDRVSSVQYLRFDAGGKVPVALGCRHPKLTVEAALSDEQRAALEADLGE